MTMKKLILALTAAAALSGPTAFAAQDMGHHGSGHGMSHVGVAHEEVVDGVTATFRFMDMKGKQPQGMKETHHIMVEFKDVASGKPLTGEVKLKLQGPDKAEQTKDLMAMQGHFGADFDLSKKGKYGVMCKFRLKDGAVRSAKFWYTVK
jgi:opacity protein-like surface antigen